MVKITKSQLKQIVAGILASDDDELPEVSVQLINPSLQSKNKRQLNQTEKVIQLQESETAKGVFRADRSWPTQCKVNEHRKLDQSIESSRISKRSARKKRCVNNATTVNSTNNEKLPSKKKPKRKPKLFKMPVFNINSRNSTNCGPGQASRDSNILINRNRNVNNSEDELPNLKIIKSGLSVYKVNNDLPIFNVQRKSRVQEKRRRVGMNNNNPEVRGECSTASNLRSSLDDKTKCQKNVFLLDFEKTHDPDVESDEDTASTLRQKESLCTSPNFTNSIIDEVKTVVDIPVKRRKYAKSLSRPARDQTKSVPELSKNNFKQKTLINGGAPITNSDVIEISDEGTDTEHELLHQNKSDSSESRRKRATKSVFNNDENPTQVESSEIPQFQIEYPNRYEGVFPWYKQAQATTSANLMQTPGVHCKSSNILEAVNQVGESPIVLETVVPVDELKHTGSIIKSTETASVNLSSNIVLIASDAISSMERLVQTTTRININEADVFCGQSSMSFDTIPHVDELELAMINITSNEASSPSWQSLSVVGNNELERRNNEIIIDKIVRANSKINSNEEDSQTCRLSRIQKSTFQSDVVGHYLPELNPLEEEIVSKRCQTPKIPENNLTVTTDYKSLMKERIQLLGTDVIALSSEENDLEFEPTQLSCSSTPNIQSSSIINDTDAASIHCQSSINISITDPVDEKGQVMTSNMTDKAASIHCRLSTSLSDTTTVVKVPQTVTSSNLNEASSNHCQSSIALGPIPSIDGVVQGQITPNEADAVHSQSYTTCSTTAQFDGLEQVTNSIEPNDSDPPHSQSIPCIDEEINLKVETNAVLPQHCLSPIVYTWVPTKLYNFARINDSMMSEETKSEFDQATCASESSSLTDTLAYATNNPEHEEISSSHFQYSNIENMNEPTTSYLKFKNNNSLTPSDCQYSYSSNLCREILPLTTSDLKINEETAFDCRRSPIIIKSASPMALPEEELLQVSTEIVPCLKSTLTELEADLNTEILADIISKGPDFFLEPEDIAADYQNNNSVPAIISNANTSTLRSTVNIPSVDNPLLILSSDTAHTRFNSLIRSTVFDVLDPIISNFDDRKAEINELKQENKSLKELMKTLSNELELARKKIVDLESWTNFHGGVRP